MRRPLALALAAALLHAAAHAQAAYPPLVVDVAVYDQSGHPLHGLNLQNFRLTDNSVPQTLTRVEEHTLPSPSSPAPTLAPLPPGTFTNYTPLAPGSTLTILLLDALNTPAKDAKFIRSQLQQYAEHANPNRRIAIIGLANRPILLQAFASNPATLRDVVEHKLIPRSTASLESPSATTQPSAMEIAANLRQFESATGAMETALRPQYTLDAFNTLAHYLAAFPGRKKLLWFSGSFPLNLLPTTSPAATDQAELHETLDLLLRAQVAIYPIDARGLMPPPRPEHAATPDHAAAEALASATGGRALYPTTTLADAVTTALAAAASYYTLTYTPTTSVNAYHPLHIELAGTHSPQPQLSYPRGYYPADPAAATPQDGRADAYKQAAMSRGAPPPVGLLVKVRALPASPATETAVAPDNQLSAFVPSKGPFRRYTIDFLAPAAQLALIPQPDGHRAAKVEFLAFVYDTEGRLLNATGTGLGLEPVTTDDARLARSLVRCHLEISVPDRTETFLRLGMRDLATNKFGVIELPTSILSNLPPAAVHPAPPR